MSSCPSNQKLDVRYVIMNGTGDDEYARLSSQLNPVERAQASRFLLLKDRLAFSAGRVLVRKILSEYSIEPPGGWQFESNLYGKPAIIRFPGTADLRFNISHSTGIVVAAISLGREIGVDVEYIEQKADYLELARSQFSSAEIELLEALPQQRQTNAFFALWTLKEAYTKARGMGLSIAFSEFAFSLEPLAISFSPQTAERPDDWFFWQDQPSSSHLLAIAAQRQPGEQLICCKEKIELRELF
jgi:4'-phosphopantetheinyl transferase